MKQKVTKKQILELSREEFKPFLNWMSNKGYYDTGEPDITIGVMIEYLGDDLDSILLATRYTVQLLDNDKMSVAFSYSEKELVDVLWMAVKYSLQNIK